jgi:hypothetical protein
LISAGDPAAQLTGIDPATFIDTIRDGRDIKKYSKNIRASHIDADRELTSNYQGL